MRNYSSPAADQVLQLVEQTTGQGFDAGNVIGLGNDFAGAKGRLYITGPISPQLEELAR